jgi:tRNA(Ile)-lysidine synthase
MAPLGPFGPSPKLALGVSGGPHSLAMALLARDWAASRGGSAFALVADHGLRPGSDAEADGVAAQLADLGIPARILSLNLHPGPALHERAREARLSALMAAAGEGGAPWLLLGHHRGDQAETLAFRLLRGSGEAGLAAMAPARATPLVLLLRPLLDVPAARLEALLKAAGLHPLRDPSNDDPRFARARLRAALADSGATGPGTAALAEAAQLFSRRRAAQEAAVAERLAACAVFHPEGWARLDRVALGADHVAEQALAASLRAVAGARHRPARDAVADLLARGGGTLGGAAWRGTLLCREPAACAPRVPAVEGTLWDGRWLLGSMVEKGLTVGALGREARNLPGEARLGLPAAVLAGLPALWRDGVLVAVPPLGWPAAGSWQMVLEPAGGPVV